MAYEVPDSHEFKAGNLLLCDIDATTSTAVHDAGYEADTDDGKVFVFKYYQSSGVAAAVGGPMVSLASSKSHVVTSDTSDSDAEGSFAGVATVIQGNSNNVYCWLQKKGVVKNALVASTVAAGDQVYVGQSEVFAAVEDDISSVSATALRAVGIAETAAAGAGTSTATVLLW